MAGKFLATGLAGLVISIFASATPAEPWDPNDPNDEMNLYEIYNELYGTSFTTNSDLDPFELASDEVFELAGSSGSVDARARYAALEQRFGYYQPTGSVPGPGDMTELFAITNEGIFAEGEYSANLNITGEFGVYDTAIGKAPFVGSDNTWYSEASLNSDGLDHLITYRTPHENVYLMAWTDLPMNTDFFDADYNDLVVELHLGGEVIPEPASMVLLGLGISGLALRRLRNNASK
jgi:hypothetical protein